MNMCRLTRITLALSEWWSLYSGFSSLFYLILLFIYLFVYDYYYHYYYYYYYY
ncbi:hypothetical protein BDV38DRAFT_242439 [Aspergillus pseudotamarii]|uniref:Uncharacterized protein n=1 Tax=Aspergillus pseudotamarii TaxID=132259 RepID=A0A5N6SXB5_ASPPS|nr:uncharacterized protein BDV38DRAFT_242439 [Aspergillus pseudotamarii]KAE8139328.1 hypothetical protein BDV38DRAFT_242439 [Aspergillus pseudotamarii]